MGQPFSEAFKLQENEPENHGGGLLLWATVLKNFRKVNKGRIGQRKITQRDASANDHGGNRHPHRVSIDCHGCLSAIASFLPTSHP
jgi:hypothetical protein